MIRLKDFQAFEFLIQDHQGLKLLGLDHLLLEPIFDLILLLFLYLFMHIIEMSI